MLFGLIKTKTERLREEIERIATNDAKLMIETLTPLTSRTARALFCTSPLSTKPEIFPAYYEVLVHRIDSINHG